MQENTVDPNLKEDTNNPSKAIDTPGEVEESNDSKIDQDFPGYPHYPAKEDILDPENNEGRLDLDVENLSRSNTKDPMHISLISGNSGDDSIIPSSVGEDPEDDLGIVAGTEADVTAEDLAILGSRERDMDMQEDEEVLSESFKDDADIRGELDIPGADDDDLMESIGEEDEENNYYSLGGDRQENLDEN
ncbi:MAG: hypothetical protein JWQ96_2165 [Segetibacter sp.]|nr:hypothetical protein [Segetibacter sp.]